MIFYFSGTGNSFYAAKIAGEYLDDKIQSIVGLSEIEFKLNADESVGIVFPVYAWNPPKPVLEFLKKLKLVNYDKNRNFIYCIAVCGANIGDTMKSVTKVLAKSGYVLDSGFSIAMPNNYILAGDVYDKEKEARMLLEADNALLNAFANIKERKRNLFVLVKGPLPWILTNIINPAFNMNLSKARPFNANDSCNGCGICAKVCTCGNIVIDGKPVWGSNCTQCLACINYCPTKAINYGKSTVNKGRYTNPNVKFNRQ